jgi:hypothetical protein
MVSIYQPQSLAFHNHRTTMFKLRKQIINFQCGYTAMLMRIISRDKDKRVFKVLYYYLPLIKWNHLKQIRSKTNYKPLSLTLLEIWGNLIGPLNFWRSLRRIDKLGYYKAEQYATHLAQREPLATKIEIP